MGIRCFLVEPAGLTRRFLRRYRSSQRPPGSTCPGPWGYHNAEVLLDTVPELPDSTGAWRLVSGDLYPHEDPRWPTRCDGCTYPFDAPDEWQLFHRRLYRSVDAPLRLWPQEDLPPGAMWFSPWHDQLYRPQLEHCVQVMLPGGHMWCIDSMASNCGLKDDYRQEHHHCWIITRGPAPNITAGKGGPTCSAGAGSIAVPGWHGFLRDGELALA